MVRDIQCQKQRKCRAEGVKFDHVEDTIKNSGKYSARKRWGTSGWRQTMLGLDEKEIKEGK